MTDPKTTALADLHQSIKGCTKCPLACDRKNIVFGSGTPYADVMFVGEAPGEQEDESGLPFVGRSGQLLTKMIEALGLTRDGVYIANIAKCRPPNNRPPTQEEMGTCSPYLVEQLKIVKPKVICALGKTAAVGLGLIKPTDALGKARGKTHKWNEIPVIITYHPSYLLRDPNQKGKAWQDLQMLIPYFKKEEHESTS